MGFTPASWSGASPVLRRGGMWLILRVRALIQHQFIIIEEEVSGDRRSRQFLSAFSLWCLFKEWHNEHNTIRLQPLLNALIHTPMTVTLTDNLNSLRLIDITIEKRKKEWLCLCRTFHKRRMSECLKKIHNILDQKKCKHALTRAYDIRVGLDENNQRREGKNLQECFSLVYFIIYFNN